MDKLDRSIIEELRGEGRFDGGAVRALEGEGEISALVRVRNPLQLGALERRFEVTHMYPFIRSVGIKCGLKEAILLERMQEVEYVSKQGRAFALSDIPSIESDKIPQNNSEQSENNHIAAKANSAEKMNAGEENGEPYDISGENSSAHLEDGSILSDEAYISGARAATLTEALSQGGGRLDGEGVTMCVMDTGVSPHLDISVPRERIVHFVDMIGDSAYPYDDNGHGTFVAGVAVGNGLLSGGKICGVAPRANVVGVKVIDKSGESGTFKILDGMQWLFDNFRQYGIKVVVMSFGAEPLDYADPLKIGAEMLVRSGLTVVVASGNSGKGTIKSPAISPDVIAVGAVNDKLEVAEFTSRGAYQGYARPDLYTYGVEVKGISAGGTYSLMSGTSTSAPYIAGACCLIHQRFRGITPKRVKQILLSCSDVIGGNRIFKL